MFQNLCRNSRYTCRMPVSLSEWRVRIGTYVPRMPQYHNLVRYLKQLLFLAVLKTLADGESNGDPSEKQEMGSTLDQQSSTDKTSSTAERDDSSSRGCDEQETSTSDNTKAMPHKTSKKRKHRSQKGSGVSGRSLEKLMSFCCFMKSGANPLLQFLLLVFTAILLVRSGDVEVNPGPNENIPNPIPDATLLHIATKIPHDKLYLLGTKLGVDFSTLKMHCTTNTMGGAANWNGTLNMLIEWRDNTSINQQEELLRNALVRSSLQAIAQQYLPEDPSSRSVMAAIQRSSLEMPNIATTMPIQAQPMDYSNQQPYPSHYHPSHNTASHQYAASSSSEDPLPSRYQGIPVIPPAFETQGSFTPLYQVGPQESQYQNQRLQPNHPSYGQLAPNGMALAQHGVTHTQHGMAPAQHGVAPAQHVMAPAQHGMAPAQHGKASAQHGVTPAQHGMAPAQHGVTPAQHGMASAQHGVAAAQHGMAPAQHGMAPAQHGVVFAQHGSAPQHFMAPAQHGMAPAQHGVAPAQPGVAPTQHAMAPAQHGVTPAQHGMAPAQHGVTLAQHGMASAQHGVAAAQHGMAPAQHGMAPAQHGMVFAQHGLAPQHGMAPANHGMAPAQHGITPAQHSMAPTQHAMAPAQHGLTPAQHGMGPAQHGMAPTQHGMAPTQHGMTPAQHSMAPAQHGMGPAQHGMASAQQDMNTGADPLLTGQHEERNTPRTYPYTQCYDPTVISQSQNTGSYHPLQLDTWETHRQSILNTPSNSQSRKLAYSQLYTHSDAGILPNVEQQERMCDISSHMNVQGSMSISNLPREFQALNLSRTPLVNPTPQQVVSCRPTPQPPYSTMRVDPSQLRTQSGTLHSAASTMSADQTNQNLSSSHPITSDLYLGYTYGASISNPSRNKGNVSGTPVQPTLMPTMDSTFLCNASLTMPSTSGHTCAQHNPSLPSSNGTNPITEAQLDRCIDDIKTSYRVNLCQIPTSPLDVDSIVELKCIFTNLFLLKEDRNTKKKIPMKYEDLLTFDINGKLAKRIMIQGEAGVGKTTFCAKIAWDWVTGDHYRDYTLVAVVPLREAKDGKTVGQVLKTYLPDDNEVTSEQLDVYIKNNQHKVLTVFDGFDEFGVEMLNGENDIVQILQGVKHTSGRVIVTTRPWKADEIANGMNLKKQFAFVRIEGFKPKDVKTYVTKFYRDDKISADTLLEFMEEGSLVTESMAPFPIFCSMLCHMWREVERREVIQKLQTFSQLFQEMIVHLKEHYISKQVHTIDDTLVQGIKNKIDGHFKKISDIAFNGLINDKLAFLKQEFESCREDLRVALGVGLLTREKTMSKRADGATRKIARFDSTFSFPHKLFQEYTAAVHLEDLFNSQYDEFDRIMKNTILLKPTQYKYLLFFTGSFNNIICKDILKRMIQKKTALNFIVEVAFEGHSEEAANVIEEMQQQRSLTIKKRTSVHVISGYMFALKDLVSIRLGGIPRSKILSRNLAEKVCSLQSLTKIELVDCNVPVSFSENLQLHSKDSMVETFLLDQVKLTKNSSIKLAKYLCSLPNLKILYIKRLKEDSWDNFFSALQPVASQSKIESLQIDTYLHNFQGDRGIIESATQTLGASICSMPCLKDVKLIGKLSDGLYSALRKGASSLKVESFQIYDNDISESASQTLGASICAMSCLKDVKLIGKLSDGFYNELREGASSLKVESFQIDDNNISESASQTLVASICAMPCLNDVKLRGKLSDGFYNELREGASSFKVESLELEVFDISVEGLQSLCASICAMPCLRSVKIQSPTGGAVAKIKLIKNVGGLSSSEVISSSCQINIKLRGEQVIAFVALLSSSQTSSVQVESLQIRLCDISESASQTLGASICAMTYVKDLKLSGKLLNGFYSALIKGASSLKVESFQIDDRGISESASQTLGASICAMPYIQHVKLSGNLSDGFYNEFREGASSLKVESLQIDGDDISESASQTLGASICVMPCLKDVQLTGKLSEGFYKELRERDSSLQVESLQIDDRGVSESASQTLGASICAMTYLKGVKLSGKLSEGFYNELREGASSLKVESLQIDDNDISESASQALGSSICDMRHLRNVKLRGKLSNGFYNDFREGASSLKIRQMHLMGAYLDSCHLSTLALMPDLKSLTLFDIKINYRNHSEMDGSDPPSIHSRTSLTELNVDQDSFISLHRIGLLKMFPGIQKMTLAFSGQTPFLRKLTHHVTMPDVTDLSLHGYEGGYLIVLSLDPFPNLIKLSLISINIGNDDCTTILDSLRNNETLKTISIKDCDTNARLDPLVNEINAEGKMMVTVEHDGESNRIILRDIFKNL